MFKVTNTCKYHSNARFVGSLDGFIVSNRATRLNNGCNTMLCRRFYSIPPKWKNASDANTAPPFAASPACSRAIFADPTRFICPPPPQHRVSVFHWKSKSHWILRVLRASTQIQGLSIVSLLAVPS